MKLFIKIFIVALILGGCYYAYSVYSTKEQTMPYITTKPTKGDIVESIESVGQVYAASSVDVGAQVSGQIQKLHVKVGDKVKKGDKIADIDNISQTDEVKKLQAQLEVYKARLEAKKVSFSTIAKELKRERMLYKKGATSLENVEKIKNSYIQEKANIKELKASIAQTNIALNTAQTNVGYTKILSPISGTIVAVLAKEGQTVNARQSTPNIAVVADLSLMEVRMQISEGDITKVKVGQKVDFHTLSSEKKFHSSIKSIDPASTSVSDSGGVSNASAVYFYAKHFVKNKDNTLHIGMTTQNSIAIQEAKNVLLLPISAIKMEKKQRYVHILKDATYIRKDIEVGISDGINIEVKSGISQEDDVITSPVGMVVDDEMDIRIGR